MQAVIDYARLCGWMVFHPFDSRRSAPGWPDLLMLRGDRMVVAELKIPPNTTTKEQDEWLEAFRGVTFSVFVWRPDDFDDIAEILA